MPVERQEAQSTVQDELDKIERKILIKLFGKESIPDKTAVLFNLFGIDPNKYIRLFEEKVKPLMKPDGSVDGAMLKKIVLFSKYKGIAEVISIPDGDFFLSEHIESLIKTFIPGGKS